MPFLQDFDEQDDASFLFQHLPLKMERLSVRSSSANTTPEAHEDTEAPEASPWRPPPRSSSAQYHAARTLGHTHDSNADREPGSERVEEPTLPMHNAPSFPAIFRSSKQKSNQNHVNGTAQTNPAQRAYSVRLDFANDDFHPALQSRSQSESAIQTQQAALLFAQDEKYKTELCRKFTTFGTCRYAEKCQFAHGDDERRMPPRPRMYKTEKCKNLLGRGHCPYGDRCRFRHDDVEPAGPTSPVDFTVRNTGSLRRLSSKEGLRVQHSKETSPVKPAFDRHVPKQTVHTNRRFRKMEKREQTVSITRLPTKDFDKEDRWMREEGDLQPGEIPQESCEEWRVRGEQPPQEPQAVSPRGIVPNETFRAQNPSNGNAGVRHRAPPVSTFRNSGPDNTLASYHNPAPEGSVSSHFTQEYYYPIPEQTIRNTSECHSNTPEGRLHHHTREKRVMTSRSTTAASSWSQSGDDFDQYLEGDQFYGEVPSETIVLHEIFRLPFYPSLDQ
eukprot:gb/GEZN01002815.1/.p1 GENE.gb/GEZN01002815.1/~~gb/GEZN01002815.1/.p1  ORF type:complete len:500 (+),score=48.88 gb/GEZN01002815.1/:33-1532(+)